MRLRLSNIILTEEELTVQIRNFDVIIVCNVDFTCLGTPDTHKGEGLDQLTTEGTCTNHKGLNLGKLFLNIAAKDTNLVIVPTAHRLSIDFLLWQGFEHVVMHPLLERGVLAGLLDNLLSYNATEESTHRRDRASREAYRFFKHIFINFNVRTKRFEIGFG